MEENNEMNHPIEETPATGGMTPTEATTSETPINALSNDTLDFGYNQTQTQTIIKVIGVGGGGSNAVKHMYEEGIQDVSFLIINTDKQALLGSPIPNKLQIGKGLGAGAHPEMAQQYALDSADDIRAKLDDGTQMVFITAGMGGGTGTGASPVVAQIAKEMGLLTVGIVTIPFKFEGPRKIQMALDGVDQIRQYVDALLIVNNDRLIQIYPDFTFFNAFSKADDTLTTAAKSISDIINIEGVVNVDFADVNTTLRNSGVAIISTGYGEGQNRVTTAINDAINSPLLMGNDIHSAKHLLFELCFSRQNEVTMQEIAELNTFISQFSDDNIEVIWGAMVDEDLGDKVKMIILSSGFDTMNVNSKPATPQRPAQQPAQPQKVQPAQPVMAQPQTQPAPQAAPAQPIQSQPAYGVQPPFVAPTPSPYAPTQPMQPTVQQPTATPAPQPMQQPYMAPGNYGCQPQPTAYAQQPFVQPQPYQQPIAPQPVAPQAPYAAPATPVAPAQPSMPQPQPAIQPAKSVADGIERISQYYGKEVADEMINQSARAAYYTIDDPELDDETLIERLEQLPAYNRRKSDLSVLKDDGQQDTGSVAGPGGTIQFGDSTLS